MTQTQLAQLVGISEGALGRLERCQAEPRLSTLARLCQVLDCKPTDLTTGAT